MPSTAYSGLSGIPKPAYITLHHLSIKLCDYCRGMLLTAGCL
jgi:hypothetical protein